MPEFQTELLIGNIDDRYWKLFYPLIYKSDLLQCTIEVPTGFESDLASVPRVPVAYWFWGGRVHREAILHDYLYRIDSIPIVSFNTANSVFLEAMKVRDKSWFVRWPMYIGVMSGGYFSYHKKKVLGR